DDLDAGLCPLPAREPDLRRELPHHVDLAGWRAIDAAERDRGRAVGRPRVKVVDLAALRGLAGAPGQRRRSRRYAARSAGRGVRELLAPR
ncbi:MAG TPA: hypothetical protein VF728_07480, partial [Nocardioides sp.]